MPLCGCGERGTLGEGEGGVGDGGAGGASYFDVVLKRYRGGEVCKWSAMSENLPFLLWRLRVDGAKCDKAVRFGRNDLFYEALSPSPRVLCCGRRYTRVRAVKHMCA